MRLQPLPSVYRPSTCSVLYGSYDSPGSRQASESGKPWTAIAAQDFIHKIDLIAPQDCCSALLRKQVEQRQKPVYARFTMQLEQLLQVDALGEDVRKGDVLLLSQGRASTDNVFSLSKGILKMYLDKETFERAGLPGKLYTAAGNRGLEPRWVVSHNLANPPGKQATQRLLYACQQVFHKPVAWLFCDADLSGSRFHLIAAHKPVIFEAEANITECRTILHMKPQVSATILATGDGCGLEETGSELIEWLSLVRLKSPRVAADDTVDSFLSRYSVPDGTDSQTKICLLSWQGFMSSSWLRTVAADALRACPPQQWISISATTLSTDIAGLGSELTLLRPSGVADEFLMWETANLDGLI